LSPIPSFVVLIPAGAAAAVQNIPLWYLPVLGVLAAAGRILGALLLYWVADKFEDKLLGGGRKFFGFSHGDVERFGRRLKHHHDWLALFMFNAIPVVPVALLSLTCGFIKLPLRTFITATFLGTIVNAVFYLGIGYGGLKTAATMQNLELATEITTGLIIAAIVGWIIYVRRKKV